MSENTCVTIFFFFMAIAGPAWALEFKSGKSKSTYLPLPVNTQTPVYWYYTGWPAGFFGLVSGVGWVIESRPVAMIGVFGGLLLAIVFLTWKPDWLKPDWLLWLEANYDAATLRFMYYQARNDEAAWVERAETQAGLEAWAKEMEGLYQAWLRQRYD